VTEVLLRDAPGGPEFTQRLADQVRDLSLFFAGEPDDRVQPVLERMRENLTRDLAAAIGAEAAAELADAFATAVRGRRAELAATAGSAGLSVQ
jgi:hypothetical protein